MLRLSLTFLSACLSVASAIRAAPRVLDATSYHLGLAGFPEWEEFENSTSHGSQLQLTFSVPTSEAGRESTLLIRQRNVKVTWHVSLNGQRLGGLELLTQPLVRALAVPADLLRAGENTLVISRAPNRMLDDIVVGEIAFDPRPVSEALGAATLDVAVLEAPADSPLPSRLTLVDNRGALMPLVPAAGQRLSVRTGVIYTGDGRARFSVAPGTYVLHASRGFEYSIASESFTLAPGEKKTFSLRLRREVPTPGFIAADTHIHTLTHSKHGDATIEERMLTIAGEGIELAVATDHNHHTDFTTPAAQASVSHHFHSVVGNEVSTKAGHFNAFPILPGSTVPDAKLTDWPHLLAHIRRVTGARVITLNHPRDVHSNFLPFAPENFDAKTGELLRAPVFDCDAIEVITSAAMHSDPMLLFRDWFALLNYGYRVAAIAASDTHDVSQFILGQARTYVASRASDPRSIDLDEICESFRCGRVLVSFGLLTTLRVNDRFTVGDLATDLGDELKIEIEVLGPSWIDADRVELFANGIKIREENLSGTGILPVLGRAEHGQDARPTHKARLVWTIPRPKHDAHLVAIATGPGVIAPHWETPRPYQATSKVFTPRVIGATNPIWLDADSDGKFSSARTQAAALLSNVGTDRNRLAAALHDYDDAVRIQLEPLLNAAASDGGRRSVAASSVSGADGAAPSTSAPSTSGQTVAEPPPVEP